MLSPVLRVTEIPPTLTFVVALIVTRPVVGELMETEQVPAVVVQVLIPPTKLAVAPFELLKLNVTSVPFAAGTKPPPVPALISTVAVIVCAEPTALVFDAGLRLMLAST